MSRERYLVPMGLVGWEESVIDLEIDWGFDAMDPALVIGEGCCGEGFVTGWADHPSLLHLAMVVAMSGHASLVCVWRHHRVGLVGKQCHCFCLSGICL